MSRKRKRAKSHGLNIVQRKGSPYLQIVGTLRGRTVRKTTGSTDPLVAAAMLKRIVDGILVEDIQGPKAVASYARAANLYLDLKPDQNTRAFKLLAKHFHAERLSEINDEKVREFVRLYYPNAMPQSVGRLVYTPLIAVMRLAAKNKLCDVPQLTRPHVKKKMVTHASPEWMKKFLTGCTNDRLRAIVRLMSGTACRVAEACRVTWEDINVERQEITLRRTKNLKTDAPRVLVVTRTLIDEIMALRTPDDPDGKRVFGFEGNHSVNQALERQASRLGLTYYSTHKLGRHAFAARLLRKGANLAEVMEAGGWAKASMRLVVETYAHLEPSRVRAKVLEAAEELEGV